MRAFGSYSIRIGHPRTLLQQLVSTDGRFETDEITEQLRSFIVQKFITWLGGSSGISVYDYAAKYAEIGEKMRQDLQGEFAQFGLELTNVVIESIGLPPEVEAGYRQADADGHSRRHEPLHAVPGRELGGSQRAERRRRKPGDGDGDGGRAGQPDDELHEPGSLGGRREPPPPPPLPNAAAWFVGVNGQQAGPFDLSALSAKAASGELTRDSLVWKQGMAGWVAAGTVGELSGVFGAVPPPLPQ